MTVSINLGQVIHALSDALDLVGVDHVLHGKRVGFMALCCGEALGFNSRQLDDLFHSGLLHDCGVSSTQTHRFLVQELDWKGVEFHCVKGSDLLSRFTPLAHLAPIVRYHHTHWDVLNALGIPQPIARWTNLIYLVDRVDALAASSGNRDILLARHDIRNTIQRLGGSFFAPDLAALFLDLSDNEAFWLRLETRHLIRFIYERERETETVSISFAELKQLALIFARVVDAKSPYTLEHSLGTARVGRFLAECVGLSSETRDKIEVAALLHDLGKLRVPDEILEKPGPLTPKERATIQHHSFETYQILRGITGLEDITWWAAYHHEKLDGRGYPFHRRGEELTIEARIIAVADVFQALAQPRPYRQPLPPVDILRMLRAFAQDQHLDGDLVETIGRNLEICWRLAMDLPVAGRLPRTDATA
ncbi:MAG: HD domain-containing protein [Candidatus Competibacteraceae bacterium]